MCNLQTAHVYSVYLSGCTIVCVSRKGWWNAWICEACDGEGKGGGGWCLANMPAVCVSVCLCAWVCVCECVCVSAADSNHLNWNDPDLRNLPSDHSWYKTRLPLPYPPVLAFLLQMHQTTVKVNHKHATSIQDGHTLNVIIQLVIAIHWKLSDAKMCCGPTNDR